MSRSRNGLSVTILLALIVAMLFFLNLEKIAAPQVAAPDNVVFDRTTNTVQLSSLTLRQKIAQMIVTYGDENDADVFKKMLIGGVYFGAKPSESDYIASVNRFQDGAVVPFFTTVDLEGCSNPFENFQNFPSFKDINTSEEAYGYGYAEGKFLKETGINVDFSPVVDLKDDIWDCRSFVGTPEEIANKSDSYIYGMQENGVIATAKHYPGKTLVSRDPHKYIVYEQIDENDLLPFKRTIRSNVSAIMVSHVIVNGSVSSGSMPSTVSQPLVQGLRNQYGGLIVTDEINMLGLKDYYASKDDMYVDLFKADNDVILNFDSDPKDLDHMISVVEGAVNRGEISEQRIDGSVTRILNAKGINVAA